jgi:gluconokinase
MQNGMSVILVMGACGVGKSTIGKALADRLGVRFIEADDFHSPENKALMGRGIPLIDDHRWSWLDTIAAEARAGQGVGVLACSALRRSYRDRLRLTISRMPIIYLSADYGPLAARVAARADHYMPASLVHSQLNTLEPPDDTEDALTFSAFDAREKIISRAQAFAIHRLGPDLTPQGDEAPIHSH